MDVLSSDCFPLLLSCLPLRTGQLGFWVLASSGRALAEGTPRLAGGE